MSALIRCARLHHTIFFYRMRNIFDKYMDDGLNALVPILGTVFMVVLYLFVCSTFLLASFVDPGIYPRGTYVCIHVFVVYV